MTRKLILTWFCWSIEIEERLWWLNTLFFSIFRKTWRVSWFELRIVFEKHVVGFNRPGLGNWMAKDPKELLFPLDDVTWKGRGTATFSFEKGRPLLKPRNATNAWRASEQGRKVVDNVWVLSMMSRITQQKCFTFLCFNRTECFKRLLFPRFERLKSSWQPGLLLHWL